MGRVGPHRPCTGTGPTLRAWGLDLDSTGNSWPRRDQAPLWAAQHGQEQTLPTGVPSKHSTGWGSVHGRSPTVDSKAGAMDTTGPGWLRSPALAGDSTATGMACGQPAASAPPGQHAHRRPRTPAGPAPLTEQQQLELAPGVALVPPQLLLDLGVNPLGLLHLIAEATRHHGLQSHRPGPGARRPPPPPPPGPALARSRPGRTRLAFGAGPGGRPVSSTAYERRSRSAAYSRPTTLRPRRRRR